MNSRTPEAGNVQSLLWSQYYEADVQHEWGKVMQQNSSYTKKYPGSEIKGIKHQKGKTL